MELAFDHHRADLGGMFDLPPRLGEYYLSDVLHDSFLTIDEEGTEAAAGSAAMVRTWASGSDDAQPRIFRADRPFLLILRHRSTGQILFFGRVTNPKV
jgi:serpin B